MKLRNLTSLASLGPEALTAREARRSGGLGPGDQEDLEARKGLYRGLYRGLTASKDQKES